MAAVTVSFEFTHLADPRIERIRRVERLIERLQLFFRFI